MSLIHKAFQSLESGTVHSEEGDFFEIWIPTCHSFSLERLFSGSPDIRPYPEPPTSPGCARRAGRRNASQTGGKCS